MDPRDIPSPLPAPVTRPRPLIEAVMAQSLREHGPASRTAAAWRWALTGHGPAPVSQAPGTGGPPTPDEITAETRHGCDTTPPQVTFPPWRNNFDHHPDRQQARRVLRWLTGAADAVPLLDLTRGRYAGARLHFARTDEELRRVRGWAQHGLRQSSALPARVPSSQAARPWQWPAEWMNAAWLRGTIAYLDWILADTPVAPLSRQHVPLDPAYALAEQDPRKIAAWRRMRGVGCGPITYEEEILTFLYAVIMQGRPGQPPAVPDELPPPQWGEAVEQAHDWATGEDAKPPADHHGCGDYHPCPGLRRCLCETAGYCLRGQCPACAHRVCKAAWGLSVSD